MSDISLSTQQRPNLSAAKRLLLEKRLGRKISGADATQTIPRRPAGARAPLSFAQERILMSARREGNPTRYVRLVEFDGALDVPALERAFGAVVRRHETLRTTFADDQGELRQVVQPAREVTFPSVDLSALDAAAQTAEIRYFADEEMRRPVDLTADPVWRAVLIKQAESRHVLLFSLLHIVSDYTSVRTLIGELAMCYEAFAQGRPLTLPELPIQYGDYAHWERRWLQGERLERLRAYWRTQLQGCPPDTRLPTDYPPPDAPSFRGKNHRLEFPAGLAPSLNALGKQADATLFMTLLAGFNALVYLRTGQEDIVVGAGNAHRRHSLTEKLIGPFNNVLMMRTRLTGSLTFLELLRRVRKVALEAYAHQDMPFALLLECLRLRDDSNSPLSQLGITLHTHQEPKAQVAPPPAPSGAVKVNITGVGGRAAIDLSLNLVEMAESLGGSVEYNADLFDDSTIARLGEDYGRLLATVAADPHVRLADLPAGA
ncbi:MAG TPA: condensation domain-containing protein [Pyrinomonadaceae bacterium]|nr:condensation domain-containing protein [Pyrinomonadaceae bacterium]